ncbi:kelch-like protein 17 isoform X3 [Rhinatrema bivittatum]|uniref:kelch-like protein 17 isoform X3 n=1 Tax=Rhinatrema bivittatum TaxID=194408 RepID=UPI00112B1995|nr:kelch-like protein 17 isoform X3 [Rhinatrema bivittatum]
MDAAPRNAPEGQEESLFRDPLHPQRVLEGLNSLRVLGGFCDVVLCCGGRDFPCHRLVLAACSSYFRAMFSHAGLLEAHQERVAINGVEPAMVGALVEYAYTAQVVINKTNVQGLLAASNLLDVLAVREACCRFMEQHMDESNCVGIHCFAEAHACPELRRRSLDYILRHFSQVCRQDEFLCLAKDKLMEIVSSDDLNVAQEEEVFEAVALWLEKEPGRKQNFEKVFEHIRLPLISPYYIHDVIEPHGVVQGSPPCQRLVSEAKDFLLLQDRRNEFFGPRTRPRRSTGTSEVIVTVGGEDDKVVLRSVESFDPLANRWRSLSCLSFAVSKHGLVATGSTLYLAGGEFSDSSASKEMWRYDPCFDSWQEMASMNVARSELGLATLDGFVFAVGGWEGCSRLDSVECYRPHTNTWHFVKPMRMAVTSPAVTAHDGLLYVMGGWQASTENTDKVECYDPKTDTWSMCSPMRERRYRPGVAVVDGKIYVLGGEEGWDRYHDTVERYCEQTDSWEIVGEMPSSRSWLSCVPLQIRKAVAAGDPREQENPGG